MTTFHLTELAEIDFDGIGSYSLKNWGYDQAAKYLSQMDQSFSKLAKNKSFGRTRDDIKPHLLVYPCNKHMIFFRRDNAGNVEILRILGQNMDFKRHL